LQSGDELQVASGQLPGSVVVVVGGSVVVVVGGNVVVTITHWLSMQRLPAPHWPQSIGVPQPLSMEPHWAPRAGQPLAAQQVPNLSVGCAFTQTPLAQLLSTMQSRGSLLGPGAAAPPVANRLSMISEAVIDFFIGPPAKKDF